MIVQVVVPGSVAEEKEEKEEQGEQPEISYSDTVKNRTNGEMTGLNLDQRKYRNVKSSNASPPAESERFHEMSTASESPPKTAIIFSSHIYTLT